MVDLVLIAFLLAAALIGFRRGLFNMLGQLFMLLLSLAATFLLLGPTSDVLVHLPVLAGLQDKLTGPILQPLAQTAGTLESAIDAFLLPPLLEGWMKTRLPEQTTPVGGILPELAGVLFHYVLTGLALLLLFFLISVLVRFVAGLMTRFSDRVPVLGPANRLGGLLIGLLAGCILLAMLLLLIGVAAPWLPGLARLVDQSVLAGYFYSVNFLLDFF